LELLLGGDGTGLRLNRPYRENLNESEILAVLDALFRRFAAERGPGERLGDFSLRVGLITPPVPNPVEVPHGTH
jgi:sulfite reductase (NADPH) hemoprotein beta-component